MDLKVFTQAIQQIADEKNIPKEKILETIEMALAAAYKRDYGKRGQIIRAHLNPDTGDVDVKQIKIVADETTVKIDEESGAENDEKIQAEKSAGDTEEKKEEQKEGRTPDETMEEPEGERTVRYNPERHLMIEEARAIKPDVQLGEELEFPLEYHEDFGRIAAQTAKQVIIQRIREIEREAVFNEYKQKEGELVSGIIQRMEGGRVFIDIGRTVGILPQEEQIPRERYRIGERLKALIVLVEQNPRGSGVFLSRSHPRFLRKLFELEVPEMSTETVEIKSIAREPGSRSKVAVASNEEGVDPVGSLVGQKGVRVMAVINELGGEKVDIIEWSDDQSQYVGHALSPAKILQVEINQNQKGATVIVPDDQLSLAIGKGGQNVRLAAKLTGWKIDVRSDQVKKEGASEPEVKKTESAEGEDNEEKTKKNKKEPEEKKQESE